MTVDSLVLWFIVWYNFVIIVIVHALSFILCYNIPGLVTAYKPAPIISRGSTSEQVYEWNQGDNQLTLVHIENCR